MAADNTILAAPADVVALGRKRWEKSGDAAVGPALEAAGNIVRTREIFVRYADEILAATGLTFGDYDILASVSVQADGIGLSRIRQLARRYFNHQTSITNIVSRLTESGFLDTFPDPNDGRVTLVSLTRTGTRRLGKAHQSLSEAQFGFSTLSVRERGTRLFDVRRSPGGA